MSDSPHAAAVVALLRHGQRQWSEYSDLLEQTGDARELLELEQGLVAHGLADEAAEEVWRWRQEEIRLVCVLDRDYPENLSLVRDRPPLIFVAGQLEPRDVRSVAVIGSRRATSTGCATARAISEHLVESGYTVVSGLAAGIDTAAHTAALTRGDRTIAVIGTGLQQCYPPQNRELQQRITSGGAVVSRFWPDAPPAPENFRLRNAVMSGISLASVIVEASPTSGARMQARLALAHGRPVLLLDSLLTQAWASELAKRPGVYVVQSAADVVAVVEGLHAEPLTA